MCTTCGCGQATAEKVPHDHDDDHDDDHGHGHSHGHDHEQGHGPDADRESGNDAMGTGRSRVVRVEQDILAANDRLAAANRRFFAERGVFVLNLVSSPGSGKTTLLARTIEALNGRFPMAVIEGDQQTALDAERIRAAGAPAVQVNTGKACHLDAHMVAHALDGLEVAEGGVLMIENVGNLICPAAFDLGESRKVVVLSVTEGEDKPLKYPDMFFAAHLMVLNKVDLLPHVSFDADRCVEYARRTNPQIQVIRLSALTGQGLEEWYDWIAGGRAATAVVARHAALEEHA